jgi:MYXO-CTERM domain-containing protein
VPRNARVWVGKMQRRGRDARVALVDGAGAEVACRSSEIGSDEGASALVLTPEGPLAARSSYGIRVEGRELARFTTGEAEWHNPAPLPAPKVSLASRHPLFAYRTTPCDEQDGVRYEFEPRWALLVADVDAGATLDPAALSGRVAALDPSALWVGASYPQDSWKGAEPGASARVRFGGFDLAGNFSGWTPERTARVPRIGCGCQSSAEAPALAAALLAFGATRRRRPALRARP